MSDRHPAPAEDELIPASAIGPNGVPAETAAPGRRPALAVTGAVTAAEAAMPLATAGYQVPRSPNLIHRVIHEREWRQAQARGYLAPSAESTATGYGGWHPGEDLMAASRPVPGCAQKRGPHRIVTFDRNCHGWRPGDGYTEAEAVRAHDEPHHEVTFRTGQHVPVGEVHAVSPALTSAQLDQAARPFFGPAATARPKTAASWDEVGEAHPHVYGDPEVHGEDAEDGDGEGIGWAANHLANDRAEDPGAENTTAHDLEFARERVPVSQIDYARHGIRDDRVYHAYQGYKRGEDVPPPVLVHRHGVFQVADGHHRAEGAHEAGRRKIDAYVHYSEHEDTPFSDGTRGPFHGARAVQREASAQPAPGRECAQKTGAQADAFPNPYHGTEQFGGRPEWHQTWFHGSKGEPDFREHHPGDPADQRRLAMPPDRRPVDSWRSPNGMLGVHFSPLHTVAHGFAMPNWPARPNRGEPPPARETASITHARLHASPAHFTSEDHLHSAIARWADEHYPGWHDERLNRHLAGAYSDPDGTRKDWQARYPEGSMEARQQAREAVHVLSWHPHLPEIARGFAGHLRRNGKSLISYANQVEGPYGSVSAIATHPSVIEPVAIEHIAPHRGAHRQGEKTWEAAGEMNEPEEMEEAIERAHTGTGKGDYTTYPRPVRLLPGYQADASVLTDCDAEAG